MTRIFFTLALLLPLAVNAQSVYQSDDYAEIGDTFQISIANTGLFGLDFTTTGADQSWDFSGLEPDEQRVLRWIDPGDGGYQLTWCLLNGYIFNCESNFQDLTNLGLIEEGGDTVQLGMVEFTDVVNHYRKTTGALELTMTGNTVNTGFPVQLPVEYTIPDTILQFPLEFGDSQSSYSEYEIDLSDLGVNFAFKSTATRTNTVDGWGSILTPFGEYSSVIRVYTLIERNDTLTVEGNVIPIPSTAIEIKWMDPEFGIPVLQANGLEGFGIPIITEVRYLDTVQCLAPEPFFLTNPQVFYDTTLQEGIISFTNLSSNADTYSWDLGDGTTIMGFEPDYGYLCPGSYEVELTAVNSCNPDIAESFSFQISVEDTTGYFFSTAEFSICQGDSILLGDTYQSEAGEYPFVLESMLGCDSTVTATLSVQEVDAQISLDGETLTSSATDAQFQWVDCENNFQFIAGETEASFTPLSSGSYAVLITQDGCEALSDCVEVVITGLAGPPELEQAIQLVPNPARDQLFLQATPSIRETTQLKVVDGMGRVLLQQELEELDQLTLEVNNLPAGLYFLHIQTAAGATTQTFLVDPKAGD
jgi:hypothetical protein